MRCAVLFRTPDNPPVQIPTATWIGFLTTGWHIKLT
ncbi:hypothetical protein CJA_2338 [Cellvibrio japonicus Ueda107]|uniref:Uncharacterized protein n=1 Tax=Cellvibrio japonicus (strain Ueda107) TaxID=498211 RepID=B3PJX6_CELJU|nr:hypothetical protein CJA_2338 [Cellvibrio japonicus Ueda107]